MPLLGEATDEVSAEASGNELSDETPSQLPAGDAVEPAASVSDTPLTGATSAADVIEPPVAVVDVSVYTAFWIVRS